MRNWLLFVSALSSILLSLPAHASEPVPFANQETMHYRIAWPSGLDVGEGTLRSERVAETAENPAGWRFSLVVEAAIPGFQVRDEYRSFATPELCSLEFTRESKHGKREAAEETTFDQSAHEAKRVTLGGGGESTMEIPECARDALAFFYHVRRELASGRVPPPGTLFFGAPYEVKIQPAGAETVELEEKQIEADQLVVTISGDTSESTFVLLIARDDARTLVRATVPLEPGNFTMELVEE